MLDIKPTVADQVGDQLSVGLGADIYTFAGFLGQGHVEPRSVVAGTPVEVNGNGTAAGFNAGLLYTPLRNDQGKPLASVGLIYRSQATLHLAGQFQSNGALVSEAKATLVLPQIFTAGIAL